MKYKSNPPNNPKKSSLSFDDSTTESNWMDQIFTNIGDIPDKEEDSDLGFVREQQPKSSKVKTSRKAFQSHTAPDETLDLHGKKSTRSFNAGGELRSLRRFART